MVLKRKGGWEMGVRAVEGVRGEGWERGVECRVACHHEDPLKAVMGMGIVAAGVRRSG